MELLTPRLRLDALGEPDAEALFRYRSDPEVSRYQGWRPASMEGALHFIQQQQGIAHDAPGTWFQRAIRLRKDDELVGDLGLHFVGEATVELGITLAPAHQGRGLAAEALSAMLDFVFGTLHKHRAFGSVDPRNATSIRLLTRLGMRKEAHLIESVRCDDGWADDAIYALLDREWSALHASGRRRG
ncbi:MAG: GNAT family N-acetyltransferase [Rhodanobacteraceae bacterium]